MLEWERISELQEAIRRALDANWPLTAELVAEYNELTERLELEVPDGEMMKSFREMCKMK